MAASGAGLSARRCIVRQRRVFLSNGMVVAIRLARTGLRHQGVFRIVAAHTKSPRDGKHIELVRCCAVLAVFAQTEPRCGCVQLGSFNPVPSGSAKYVSLNFERTRCVHVRGVLCVSFLRIVHAGIGSLWAHNPPILLRGCLAWCADRHTQHK